MSSPAEWYNSLPPISKGYGTLCLLATTITQLGLLHPYYLALLYERVFMNLEALSAIPFFNYGFGAISLVFMLLYVWSREFSNATINMYGLFTLKVFYLPWMMLALDVIFGSPIWPDFLRIIAGHLFYFLTVLYPLAGGKNILNTPVWIHKKVARWRLGAPASSRPSAAARGSVQPERNTGAFRGRGVELTVLVIEQTCSCEPIQNDSI